MNKQQYEQLCGEVINSLVTVKDLQNKSPRTLLYGYDFDRNTWHVYLGDDGEIHVLTYSFKDFLLSHKSGSQITDNDQYLPPKRVYPNRSDFEFCSLLKMRGVYISFTTFQEEVANEAGVSAKYHGLLLNEVTETATSSFSFADVFKEYVLSEDDSTKLLVQKLFQAGAFNIHEECLVTSGRMFAKKSALDVIKEEARCRASELGLTCNTDRQALSVEFLRDAEQQHSFKNVFEPENGFNRSFMYNNDVYDLYEFAFGYYFQVDKLTEDEVLSPEHTKFDVALEDINKNKVKLYNVTYDGADTTTVVRQLGLGYGSDGRVREVRIFLFGSGEAYYAKLRERMGRRSAIKS